MYIHIYIYAYMQSLICDPPLEPMLDPPMKPMDIYQRFTHLDKLYYCHLF